LLQDLEAGAIEPADALAKVREGRRLFELAKAPLPPGQTIPQARATCRNVDPEHQLRLMALTRYLDLHFRNDEEGTLLDAEVLTMVEPKTMKEGGQQHV